MSTDSIDCDDPSIEHKRGDTFEVQAIYSDDEGVPINLGGYEIHSQIRRPNGTLVADVVVTVSDQTSPENDGKYNMRVSDTSAWPLGEVMWDIRYSFDDTLISTETVFFKVVDNVTRG